MITIKITIERPANNKLCNQLILKEKPLRASNGERKSLPPSSWRRAALVVQKSPETPIKPFFPHFSQTNS